jgi:cation diffusion facilitator CzcD-associated flavoprotein CzcO
MAGEVGIESKVCIIGAGPSGLASALALNAEGIDFDIFDPRDRIGGIWAYDLAPGRTCAWETMNLNSPRGHYEFVGFPMPESYPDFPRRDQVAAYLEAVTDKAGLRPHLKLSEAVTEVTPEGALWRVRTEAGRDALYRAVIVANGHHNAPFIPEHPGDFAGTTMHSQDYRYREALRGKRVLVVGIGNSGSQIAVDVSLAAEQTFLSVRRGVWVVPHYIRGYRVDRVLTPFLNYLVNAYLPGKMAGPLLSLYYRMLLGRPDRLGLPRPDHHFTSALPTVSENLFNRLGDGRIAIKPDIASFAGRQVLFADGSRETVDAIVWCTGYRNRFPFLGADLFAPEENRAPLYFRVFHPDRQGLYFVGLLQAVSLGFLPMFEAQARLVAAHLSGRYALPARELMQRSIAQDAALVARRFVNSPRNHYIMNGEVFRHACARELRNGARRMLAQH